jgi:hypothetical protein
MKHPGKLQRGMEREMGKSEAKKRADAGGISIGDLREMIAKARGKRTVCNINPQLTHEEALDIFEKGLAGRDDSEVPITLAEDVYRPNRMKPTRDHLVISNILRVCL